MRGSEVYLWNSSIINSVCLFLVYPQSHCRTPVQKLFGDHFGVDGKKIGDHFGVGINSGSIWGSFRDRGSFQGRDHFGGCTAPRQFLAVRSTWEKHNEKKNKTKQNKNKNKTNKIKQTTTTKTLTFESMQSLAQSNYKRCVKTAKA